MSERIYLEVSEEATVQDYFPEDTNPTIESIISDLDALDDNGSASTPSINSLPTAPANVSHSAPGDAAGEVERTPHPLVIRCTLMCSKRHYADDLVSLFRAQTVQHRICREKEHQRRDQERKERPEYKKGFTCTMRCGGERT